MKKEQRIAPWLIGIVAALPFVGMAILMQKKVATSSNTIQEVSYGTIKIPLTQRLSWSNNKVVGLSGELAIHANGCNEFGEIIQTEGVEKTEGARMIALLTEPHGCRLYCIRITKEWELFSTSVESDPKEPKNWKRLPKDDVDFLPTSATVEVCEKEMTIARLFGN